MVDYLDQRKASLVAIGIMIAIFAFLAPSAFYYPLKVGLITRDAEQIGMSSWGLLTGAIGLLSLASIFFIFAYTEKKKPRISFTIFFSIIVFFGNALSICDYYYTTREHFIVNDSFTFEEKTYKWDDFVSVEELLMNIDGSLHVDGVIFRMKDGNQIKYESGVMMRSMYRLIAYRVEAAGGEHIRTRIN